jgi:hypothetical protein
MQVLAASVSELLDEKDSLKAELHSLQLSRRGDLLKVETELDILRDNCLKQQKVLEDLEQAKELLHKKLLQAAEKNLALESQVQQLQSDMRQVTTSRERQHIHDCATVNEMLEELERHRTANRELYAALVTARAASSTNGPECLLLHPPHVLSPPLPSFLRTFRFFCQSGQKINRRLSFRCSRKKTSAAEFRLRGKMPSGSRRGASVLVFPSVPQPTGGRGGGKVVGSLSGLVCGQLRRPDPAGIQNGLVGVARLLCM